MQQFNVLWLRCNKSCLLSSACKIRGGFQVHIRFHRLLLVEVFASSRQARQLFIEDIFLGAHAVTFHVLCPVQLTHIKIKHLQCKEEKKTSENFKIKTWSVGVEMEPSNDNYTDLYTILLTFICVQCPNNSSPHYFQHPWHLEQIMGANSGSFSHLKQDKVIRAWRTTWENGLR